MGPGGWVELCWLIWLMYTGIVWWNFSPPGFKMGNLPVKYLGVPFITGRLKSADYQVLVDKITQRFQHWRQNFSLSPRYFKWTPLLFLAFKHTGVACLFSQTSYQNYWKKVYVVHLFEMVLYGQLGVNGNVLKERSIWSLKTPNDSTQGTGGNYWR